MKLRCSCIHLAKFKSLSIHHLNHKALLDLSNVYVIIVECNPVKDKVQLHTSKRQENSHRGGSGGSEVTLQLKLDSILIIDIKLQFKSET